MSRTYRRTRLVFPTPRSPTRHTFSLTRSVRIWLCHETTPRSGYKPFENILRFGSPVRVWGSPLGGLPQPGLFAPHEPCERAEEEEDEARRRDHEYAGIAEGHEERDEEEAEPDAAEPCRAPPPSVRAEGREHGPKSVRAISLWRTRPSRGSVTPK